MTKKVFIVTGAEIAAYTSAQQESLLTSLEKLAAEYPTASIKDLTNYARENLVLQSTGTKTTIVEEVISPEETVSDELEITPVAEEVLGFSTDYEVEANTVEVFEQVETDEQQQLEVVEYPVSEAVEIEVNSEQFAEEYTPEEAPVYELPVQEISIQEEYQPQASEPVYEEQPVYVQELATEEEVVSEAVEQEELPAVADDAQVAFRNNKFQGLLREVGRLDN